MKQKKEGTARKKKVPAPPVTSKELDPEKFLDLSVLIKHRCNRCGGDGYVYNPVWQQFGELVSGYMKQHNQVAWPTPNELAQAGIHYPSPKELQQLPCPECKGTKVVNDLISIDQLKSLLRRKHGKA